MTPLNIISLKTVIEGILTFIPGFEKILTKTTLGTDSARYCYSVWLRHSIKTRPYQVNDCMDAVVELGPGDSLGIGLSALLAGARKYIAVDIIKYADPERNRRILNELEVLFSKRSPIPDFDEFPELKPSLDSYHFPKWLASSPELHLNKRIETIKRALTDTCMPNSQIAYMSPDVAHKNIPENSVDFIFSQAVLEHVEDLDLLYHDCFNWLAPGGIISHQIDFKSHGTSLEWNGHWTYPTFFWKMIKGRRPYLINRKPCSIHLNKIRAAGFEIVAIERYRLKSILKPNHLAKNFCHLSSDDLTTAGAYVIARKPTTEV